MRITVLLRLRLIVPALVIWAFTVASVLADESGGVPQREDIDDKYKWRVEDIYETPADWEEDFGLLKSSLGSFEQYQGHLGDSPEVLLDCLRLSDSLDIIAGNLYVYAYLKLDEDNRRSEFQELGGRISALSAELEQAVAFIEPEILTLDPAVLESNLEQNQKLALYRFYLEDQMRRREHILSAKEEAILALAGPLAASPLRIFTMIDDADHKLGTIVDSTGNTIELTRGRYYRILEGSDRELRRQANDTVQQSWLQYINTLSATLGASLQQDLFFTKARGYNSCLESSLDQYNIPLSVFHSLIATVNENLEPLHKLTSLRKRILGYDTLFTFDLSAPFLPEFEREYTYEETRAIVLDGLKPLGQSYLDDFEMGLNSGWVDAFENEGKGSGAYSWGTYTSHPYVLMNFNGTLDNLFTLAHEMGHAMNSFYSNRSEPYIYNDQSLFTAEVASTCNEAILMKYLLANAESKEEKMVLLNHYIKQIDGTFFTQVMFSEFELAVHSRIEAGEAVSVDYFRQTYRDIFQKYYGPDLYIGENNDLGCLKLYHYYRQYYVYQYSTSYAAAQALSQQIMSGDQEALERYMRFLATGSSKYPVDILKVAGVDMTGPETVRRTIELFGELVDEMERLLLDES
ncbi:MAG: oligoendopeptidase F [candidate division Zixibacteria bacterium]|nr:oligoendopeptidase F [candidate division Zixibacteria bacterium]